MHNIHCDSSFEGALVEWKKGEDDIAAVRKRAYSLSEPLS
jgi:hypothetical protein